MTNLRNRRVSTDDDASPKASDSTPKKRASRGSTTPKTESKQKASSPTTVADAPTGPFKLQEYSDDELAKLCAAYALPSGLSRAAMLEELNPFADGIMAERPRNLCVEPPPFTLKTLRDAIPAHCFKRSLPTSLMHLASDLALVASFFYLATWIDTYEALPVWSKYVLWPIYWGAQGSVLTGVWVLAHECGHQAFSDYAWVNNLIGTITHSALLVPYHSWRITHGKHHNNTGSCDNDEVFSPAFRSDWKNEMLRESPLAHLFGIVIMLTLGWPGYLVSNMSGPHKYRGKNANHFSPSAVFFKEDEYGIIVQSVSAWLIAVACIIQAVRVFGFSAVAFYYFIPYLIVNYHLVLITYLQHTDVFIPHFRDKEWNWLRGALCTVDRSFGPVLDHTFHHIVDTHVCHHLFSTMPFYHAQEATQAIRKVLGEKYYLKDETPIWKALYRSFSNCQFIEDEGGVVFYKNMK